MRTRGLSGPLVVRTLTAKAVRSVGNYIGMPPVVPPPAINNAGEGTEPPIQNNTVE